MDDINPNDDGLTAKILAWSLVILGALLTSSRAIVPYFFTLGTGNEPIFTISEGIGVSLVAAGIISLIYGRMERQSEIDRRRLMLDIKNVTIDAMVRQEQNTSAAMNRLEEMIRVDTNSAIHELAATAGLSESLRSSGIKQVFTSRDIDGYRQDDWSKMVTTAIRHFRVLGIANHAYKRRTEEGSPDGFDYPKEFESAIKRRVKIEILWLNPNSELCAILDRGEKPGTSDEIRETIVWFWDNVRSRLTTDDELGRLSLKVYEATPSCSIVWKDEQMAVVHYLPGFANKHSPGLHLAYNHSRPSLAGEAGSRIFVKYRELYTSVSTTANNDVWHTKPVDESMIEDFRVHLAK